MKLYYFPGACSLSPHIVACEAGVELTLEKVDPVTKKLSDGRDFAAINPKGYVPALQLDSGELLTEGPVIAQYIADLKPGSGLAPASGSLDRYRVQEWLGYINSELHKTYSALFAALFNPATPAEVTAERTAYLRKRYAYVDDHLKGKSYLLGERFTVADAYLFTVTNWANRLKIDLSAYPNLMAFQQRAGSRAGVRKALVEEGLMAA